MVQKADPADSFIIARLHHQAIQEGFLSKLGVGVLTLLYAYLIEKELVLVYKKNLRVTGFISCALNTRGMAKRFLVSKPGAILKVLWVLMMHPKMIYPLYESIQAIHQSRYSFKENIPLPATELLSITVDPHIQQANIGTQLLLSLELHLRNSGITSYKVVAGASLVGANKFYVKNGFRLATQITIHGEKPSNIYIRDL